MDPEYFKSYNMSWGTLGTVRPFSNFHPDRDVLEIQAALQSKDMLTLVRILTNRSNAQRQVIASTFQEMTQKDLDAALRKALSGELENFLLDLMMPSLEYDAYRLQQAMAGIGTDEESLLEILCTCSGQQLQKTSVVYKQMYKKDLEKDVKGETSGDFAKLVVALLNVMQKEEVVSGVQRDVESLSASLSGRKADAEPWINILTSRSSDHLNHVLMELELESGHLTEDLMEKRFSGDLQLGLKILVECIKDPYTYLATRIATMKPSILQRIMVAHSEEDLLCIRVAFLKLTGTSLFTALQGKQFKGDHLQALLAICRSED